MHFGAYYHKDPREVERKFVRFLESIRHEAKAIILVGDIFDYWFEYRYVVPRGYTRVIGKLGELADEGVEIHLFTGNHDIWIFDYLPEEIGCQIHRDPTTFTFNGHKFFVAHGDEFVTEDKGFRLIRWIFHNKLCQKIYATLHPWWTVGFAHRWALHSRRKGLRKAEANQARIEAGYYPKEDHKYHGSYKGEAEEYLVRATKELIAKAPEDAADFYLYGHRHIMLDLMLTRRSRLIILGDWIHYFSYAVWDGTTLILDCFEEGETQDPIE